MKIKKSYINISLVILILSLTVGATINQSFKPQYRLETPKSSADEITIITPENKTYTEPMSGYFPGTYSFEGDDANSNPNGFTVDEVGGSVNVKDNIGGHDKVVEVYDTSGSFEPELRNSFPIQTNGTVEFWMMSDDVTDATYFRLMDDSATSLYTPGIGRVALDEDKIRYLDDLGWHDTLKVVYDNTWYHVKIEFECSSGNYRGLAQYNWRFYIDGEVFGDFGFEFNVQNVSQAYFFTYWDDTNYRCYIDAIGYSWDPSYTLGSNLNEGLLLSYESSINLDWKAYSLDGQVNKTMLGNTTIPMPANGAHTIQLFGNDSIDTMYKSAVQYFSVDTTPYINIITPENKTYTEPMSGYFPGTYSFEGDDVNSNPNGFTVDEVGGSVNVKDNIGGHDKVVEVYDTSGAYEPELRNSFPIQTNGTVEFWMMSDDVTDATYFRLMDDSATSLYTPGIGRVALDEDKIRYLDDLGWHDTSKVVYDNTWYHVKIEFECSSGNYRGLAQHSWRFYIDGDVFGDFGFEFSVQNVSQAYFFTYWDDTNYRCYIDAIGYSWDPSYTLGGNLNEGLLLSYESSTTLDWKAYSLDGQVNKTILGNTTIPILTDGVHSIQVFGNDSIGTMYESDIRYFTTNTIAPSIIINSPLSNILIDLVSPSFDLTIPDLDVTNKWYSLDGGTTNIPFIGVTGDINQIEWDKIGNGTVTIIFYANDTANNIGESEVTVRKDVLGPIITINSPQDNDVFSFNAPQYDLSIEEFNLDSIWYSFDYGVTTLPLYTLTGTLDQAEWETEGGGTIPIRFYANDSLGHESFADVLVVKDITNPIITINSPSGGEVFGHLPPDYDISITESNLDSYWYTLDGGSINVTMNSFTGTINQTEWEKHGNGTITIRFYAKDEGGNEGFAEITVRKDINIPLITINSPNANDIFGLQPPQYDISVVEPDIDSMWYTLDNGITNTSFTEFTGTIDQTEWDKFGDSIVIIRFYVRDKGGNEGFAEVSVTKDLIVPIVTINEPEFGEVFVDIAPLYSITIDEASLDSFWYSLDDGQTNYTISELTGTIDQDAWDSLSDGYVTLRFYAKDEAGNVGQSSTMITKRTTPESTPPGIPGYNIVILIGVSSAVTFIILKRRTTKN